MNKVKWAVVGLALGQTDKDNPKNLECVAEGFDTMEQAYDYMDCNESLFLHGCETNDQTCNRFSDWWVESYKGQWFTLEV